MSNNVYSLSFSATTSLRYQFCFYLFSSSRYQSKVLENAVFTLQRGACGFFYEKLTSLTLLLLVTHRDLGDYSSALAYFDRALEMEPTSEVALHLKIKLLHERGFPESALESVRVSLGSSRLKCVCASVCI